MIAHDLTVQYAEQVTDLRRFRGKIFLDEHELHGVTDVQVHWKAADVARVTLTMVVKKVNVLEPGQVALTEATPEDIEAIEDDLQEANPSVRSFGRLLALLRYQRYGFDQGSRAALAMAVGVTAHHIFEWEFDRYVQLTPGRLRALCVALDCPFIEEGFIERYFPGIEVTPEVAALLESARQGA